MTVIDASATSPDRPYCIEARGGLYWLTRAELEALHRQISEALGRSHNRA